MRSKIILFFLLVCHNTFSQGYHISGTIPASQNGQYIYLYGIDYSGLNPVIRDSAIINNGKFHFRGSIHTPGMLASLYLKDSKVFFSQFFIENRDIMVTALLRDYSRPIHKLLTRNSPVTTQYEAWKACTDPLFTSSFLLSRTIDSMKNAKLPDTTVAPLKATLDKQRTALKMAKINFIRSHPDYYISLVWLCYDLAPGLSHTPALLDSLYDHLSPELKMLPEGKALQENIAIINNLQPGKLLQDFNIPDTSGRPVKLSGFRGSYLVVDFWASWCQPCVAAIPALKELYNTYHPKGLQVISISLDDKKGKWLTAVEKYRMPWAQVSQLQGWKSPVARQYNINAIPRTILLDKEGRIIALDPDLATTLPTLFK
jgi:thiol-disulfide isomerase/thioredoxin